MLQKEFESKTGLTVSAEEYKTIDALYMDTNLAKDDFCAAYVAGMENNKIVEDLRNRLNIYVSSFDSHVSERNNVGKRLLDIAAEISDLAVKTNIESVSWALLTRKEYTLYKIEKGYKLDDSDIEYLKHNLQ